ncbi:MAG: transposase [Candidatus Carbobacillus altaicus]|nr:transposase [Candidatus Carbobacillus altaicus]
MSVIKSDLGLERLPSGKFQTNDLVLHLGLLAYNLLRIIGEVCLRIGGAPLRKHVHRWRIKSVIQNMITIAVRVVRHARRFKFVFGKHSPWAGVVSRQENDFSGNQQHKACVFVV